MGQPKLLLPWGKTTVIGHLIAQWQKAGASQIAIVTAVGDQALAKELDRLALPPEDRLCNPAPELGMFSSIQCAALGHCFGRSTPPARGNTSCPAQIGRGSP